MSVRDKVMQGGRWVIGQGNSVKVWNDRWLPMQNTFTHSRPSVEVPVNSLVADLVLPNTRQWDRGKIFRNFCPADAKQITNIPLAFSMVTDKFIWHEEKSGIYSVKSAYHLFCKEKFRDMPGGSSVADADLWKEIWKSPLPNSIRNFLWRLAKNILPTKANLRKKSISTDSVCSFCSSSDENTEHLFMECPITKQIFFGSQLGARIPDQSNINGWLLQWLTCRDTFGAQLFCTTLWKIWFARNQLIFNNVVANPREINKAAAEFVAEYSAANPRHNSGASNVSSGVDWSGQLAAKHVYVDAGCFSEGGTGWGLVVTDIQAAVSFSACKRDSASVSPVMAEGLGLRWALGMVEDLNITDVQIVTDADLVVKCLNSDLVIADMVPIMVDCKEILNRNTSVKVSYVRRSCNSAAHDLASLSRRCGAKSWTGYPSRDVFNFYHVYTTFGGNIPTI